MPLQETSGAASFDAFGGGGGAALPVYVEDVYSTYLYTGNATARFIPNGISLGNTNSGTSIQFFVNNYLVRDGDFTGNTDGKTFTCSFWVFPTTTYHTIFRSDSSRVEILVSSNKVTFDFKNTSGSSILRGSTDGTPVPYGQFSSVVMSANLATSTFQIYVNDVSQTITYNNGPTNADIDFTDVAFGIGAYAGGSLSSNFFLSNFYLDKTYRDLSVTANRRLFVTADSKPATGQASLNPLIYFPFTTSATTNAGTGGNATTVGSPAIITFGPDSTTGFDKGGLVWMKNRSSTSNNSLYDTARGATLNLISNTTDVETTVSTGLTAFNASGFTIGSSSTVNVINDLQTSWTFREQPKFFDIVTYSGNGVAGRTVAHNLGSVPGFIIVKCRNQAGRDWAVYHRGLTSAAYSIYLNKNETQFLDNNFWNSTAPTSSVFSVGVDSNTNAVGNNYVAYLFAHDAGGFGLTGADNVITCGTYLGSNHRAQEIVTLGYEPQWVMIKNITTNITRWVIVDNMRGMPVSTNARDAWLAANSANAETTTVADQVCAAATGFYFNGTESDVNEAGATFIYVAIRRGPMRVPTSAATVFSPIANSSPTGTALVTTFPIDMQIAKDRGSGGYFPMWHDRLRGVVSVVNNGSTVNARYLDSASTAAEVSNPSYSNNFNSTGFATAPGWNNFDMVYWNFRRAPGFMDVVCYTGTGVARTVTHNLAAVPELIIIKGRSGASGWLVASNGLLGTSTSAYLVLNTTVAVNNITNWFQAPTSTTIGVGSGAPNDGSLNESGRTYVAYLFATVAGVSKVGTYTGTGTTQVINCGFTAGSRFVMIKATSTTGNWMVWDSARGIVPGNDPYLVLNSVVTEVTNTDWVDTAATGFELSNAGGNLANTNGVSYIFLAIA
jgi:hypothetical protein